MKQYLIISFFVGCLAAAASPMNTQTPIAPKERALADSDNKLVAPTLPFVFGSQYLRYPTPTSESWPHDLARMKQLGMNTVKIWVSWNQIEPNEGNFDFSMSDAIMDAIDHAGLKAVVNLIYTPPRWVKGTEQNFDNPQYFDSVSRFVRRMVERYAIHPAMLVWDCWNEPAISFPSGPSTLAQYRKWLTTRYDSPKAAGIVWGRPFAWGRSVITDWSEVEAPPLGFLAESLDWYRFHREHLPEQFSRLGAIIRKADPHHPVMVHDVFTGVTAVHTPYNDEMNMLPLDLHGVSLHVPAAQYEHADFVTENCRYTFAITMKTGVCRKLKKAFWVSESFGGALTFSLPSPPTPGPETLRKNMWQAVALGVQGFLFWQYRPERYPMPGTEDGGWGLTDLAGDDTERSKAVAEFAREVAPLVPLIPLVPARARSAIVVNDLTAFALDTRKRPEQLSAGMSQYTTFERQALEAPYVSAVLGAYRAFTTCNIPVDILSVQDSLDNYELIYLPLPMQMDTVVAERIRAFVERGGTAVLECGAGFYGEHGWVSEVVPGNGLANLFGVKEGEYRYHGVHRTLMDGGLSVSVAYRTGDLHVGTARVTGRFPDGSPARTEQVFGKGKAIYLASSPSIAVFSEPANTGEALIRSLNIKPEIVGEGIEIRRAHRGDSEFIFIFNHSSKAQTVRVSESSSHLFTPIRGRINYDGQALRCSIPARDLAIALSKR